jgi:hypothetical protein
MMIQMFWDMMWFQIFRRNVMSESTGAKQFKNIICFDSLTLEDYSTAFSPKRRRPSTKRHDVTS